MDNRPGALLAGVAAAVVIGFAGGTQVAAFIGMVVVGTVVLMLLDEKDDKTDEK